MPCVSMRNTAISSPVSLLRMNGVSHIQMPVVLRLRPARHEKPFSPWVCSMLELPSSLASPEPSTPASTHSFQTWPSGAASAPSFITRPWFAWRR
uniref:Uncharacterized protein n=1 Tax=Globisporangium ultimum (strain ATCC 200006 / CBS 805.95 / DAOM BR144) TaxID=431595 RepID=K3WDF8_GLOUD